MNTDSLIQRKQLAGRKYSVGFFPFPSLSTFFISLLSTLLALWPGKQLQAALVLSVAVGFFTVRKALVI